MLYKLRLTAEQQFLQRRESLSQGDDDHLPRYVAEELHQRADISPQSENRLLRYFEYGYGPVRDAYTRSRARLKFFNRILLRMRHLEKPFALDAVTSSQLCRNTMAAHAHKLLTVILSFLTGGVMVPGRGEEYALSQVLFSLETDFGRTSTRDQILASAEKIVQRLALGTVDMYVVYRSTVPSTDTSANVGWQRMGKFPLLMEMRIAEVDSIDWYGLDGCWR